MVLLQGERNDINMVRGADVVSLLVTVISKPVTFSLAPGQCLHHLCYKNLGSFEQKQKTTKQVPSGEDKKTR